MSERMLKVNNLIIQQLGQIICEEIEFPVGTLVTVTQVKTAADLKQAKVYVSVLPEDKRGKVIKILSSQARNLHHILNERIAFKNVPKLFFLIDDSEDKVKEIDELLDNLEVS